MGGGRVKVRTLKTNNEMEFAEKMADQLQMTVTSKRRHIGNKAIVIA